ncbi:TetR/AcrR family transcriptional regulator [Paenibacillus sp. sptzw28]|uniref:TetR/AcrR family transcriptional regulator n=1 Tax=Paenibacillus sp. sptzw28 TaxID=715179 RepID=UPI001C6DFBA0|nr:TetR/AcrR family transcriptional regulator [Paenibacillus sp. sptzw28]QYR22260.1 TetR/AcrR family transcriptional regulator [Paenibacillus sp. sptzw28]
MNSRELSSRAQAKQAQIRSAAERLFLKNGFAATSMDAITAEAGVSKQTIYTYYPSKEDLLVDVLKQVIHGLTDNLFSLGSMVINSRDELRQALNALAHQFISTLMQSSYLALVRVIIAESPRFPQLGKLFRSTVPEQVVKSVSAILEQSNVKGLVKITDVNGAVRMFVGPLLTYILLDGLLITDRPPEQPDPQDIEAIVSLYLKALEHNDKGV